MYFDPLQIEKAETRGHTGAGGGRGGQAETRVSRGAPGSPEDHRGWEGARKAPARSLRGSVALPTPGFRFWPPGLGEATSLLSRATSPWCLVTRPGRPAYGPAALGVGGGRLGLERGIQRLACWTPSSAGPPPRARSSYPRCRRSGAAGRGTGRWRELLLPGVRSAHSFCASPLAWSWSPSLAGAAAQLGPGGPPQKGDRRRTEGFTVWLLPSPAESGWPRGPVRAAVQGPTPPPSSLPERSAADAMGTGRTRVDRGVKERGARAPRGTTLPGARTGRPAPPARHGVRSTGPAWRTRGEKRRRTCGRAPGTVRRHAERPRPALQRGKWPGRGAVRTQEAAGHGVRAAAGAVGGGS